MPLPSHTKVSKAGGVFIPVMLLLALFSFMLGMWYQQEIEHRFQAQRLLDWKQLRFEQESLMELGLLMLSEFSSKELEQSQELTHPALEESFPHWHITSQPASFSEDIISIQLLYEKGTQQLIYEGLYHRHNYALSEQPWIVFAPYQGSKIPSWLDLEEPFLTEAQSASTFHLKPPAVEVYFDAEFTEPAMLEILPEKVIIWIENTSQHILLDQKLALQFFENVEITGSLGEALTQSIFIKGHKDIYLAPLPTEASFSGNAPSLFLHALGQLFISEAGGAGDAYQVNAYAWLEGESCFGEHEIVSQIFWKGSLACHHLKNNMQVPSIYLKHQVFSKPSEIPESFYQTSLEINQAQLVE